LSFEKVFAEIVLESFSRETDSHNQITVKAEDFKTALNSMGKITFKLDLSFAYLMQSQLDKDTYEEHFGLLDEASDTILSEIINRNFIRCPVD
jgi:hypothetical protein